MNFVNRARLLAVIFIICGTESTHAAIRPPLSLVGLRLRGCAQIIYPVAVTIDAIPYARKFLNKVLTKNWLDQFDVALYEKLKAEYLKSETITLESWGFPEASLAYLEAIIERSSGMKLTLADSILDDPTRARKLQLLLSRFDLQKPITPHKIELLVEDAFLMTNRLDVTFKDLLTLRSKKVRSILHEHARKEIAKVGFLKLYEDLGFLKKENFWEKSKRILSDPRVETLLFIPSWTSIATTGYPGLLPSVNWIRISNSDLLRMMKDGIDAVLPSLEPELRRALAVQKTYDAAQSILGFWGGLLLIAYGTGELNGMNNEELIKFLRDFFITDDGEIQTRSASGHQ